MDNPHQHQRTREETHYAAGRWPLDHASMLSSSRLPRHVKRLQPLVWLPPIRDMTVC
jgi:hypothetical protein